MTIFFFNFELGKELTSLILYISTSKDGFWFAYLIEEKLRLYATKRFPW